MTAGAPSAGGTTAAAAAAAGTGDATGDTGHTGHTGVVLDGAVAGTAALAPGAPFGLAGYNLTVVQAGPSGLGLSGAATLRSADGFADVRINPASRLVVDPAPRPVDAALAALDPDAHHHTAAGRLVVDLPDGTVLAVTLAGTVVHHGSPLLLVQGADLDIAATFDAGVSIPDGVAVSPRHTLPLNGAGAFTGSLVIDTRTGAARLSLQRAA
ncbi:MAG TPA: hypothetical protein DEP69_04650 [Acidimicrobiaceae bacterium]|nr:hypothetical protein [Acidimicrobiaceae bacterium]